MAGCIALEDELKQRFDLEHCEVVPNVDDGPLPLRTLGTAGARYLRHALDRGRDKVIALGHGRTLAASIDYLPTHAVVPSVRFVSLLGGLTRRFSANPFDVIQRLAEKTGAEAYLLPVPFFANSIADKKVLLSQLGIGDVIEHGGSRLAAHRRHRRGERGKLSAYGRDGRRRRKSRPCARPARRAKCSAISSRSTAGTSPTICPTARWRRTRTGSEDEGSWP